MEVRARQRTRLRYLAVGQCGCAGTTVVLIGHALALSYSRALSRTLPDDRVVMERDGKSWSERRESVQNGETRGIMRTFCTGTVDDDLPLGEHPRGVRKG